MIPDAPYIRMAEETGYAYPLRFERCGKCGGRAEVATPLGQCYCKRCAVHDAAEIRDDEARALRRDAAELEALDGDALLEHYEYYSIL